jgi:hypothetical protein
MTLPDRGGVKEVWFTLLAEEALAGAEAGTASCSLAELQE